MLRPEDEELEEAGVDVCDQAGLETVQLNLGTLNIPACEAGKRA
jgi:hypothetical protein